MESLITNLSHGGRSVSFSLSDFNLSSKPVLPSLFTANSKLHFAESLNHRFSHRSSKSRVFCSSNHDRVKNPAIRRIRTGVGAAILAAALLVGKFSRFPAKAEVPPVVKVEQAEINGSASENLQETNADTVDGLKSLLLKKLEDGEDSEGLKILKRLVAAQPDDLEWKFLMARLLNEMGNLEESRKVFEEILQVNPLCFEALFENALLMDRCGEGAAVLERLQEALKVAQTEEKEKEARDVKLIMAQILFLQKNVDGALRSYQELAMDDPKDYRPYFCRGVIYSLLDRNNEAREQFAKYHELAPKKFDVDGYLQTPLSRMKLFGTDSDK